MGFPEAGEIELTICEKSAHTGGLTGSFEYSSRRNHGNFSRLISGQVCRAEALGGAGARVTQRLIF